MIVYRLALYDLDGALVRTSDAFPFDDACGPQVVADLCARAAETGSGKYRAGTFAVWADHEAQPTKIIEQASKPDGKCSFGTTDKGVRR